MATSLKSFPSAQVLHYSCYEYPKPWWNFGPKEILCFRRDDLRNQILFDLIGPGTGAKAIPTINIAYQGHSVDREALEDKVEVDALKIHFGKTPVKIGVRDVSYEGPRTVSYAVTIPEITAENPSTQ
jgi:hypothetical protein